MQAERGGISVSRIDGGGGGVSVANPRSVAPGDAGAPSPRGSAAAGFEFDSLSD